MKKIVLIGNVSRDPIINKGSDGSEFAFFSLAVDVGSKENKKTDWIDINCNGNKVEFAKNYIKKGTKLYIEGFPVAKLFGGENPTPIIQVYANEIKLLGKFKSNPEEKEAVKNE